MNKSAQIIKETLKQIFRVPGTIETYLWVHDILGQSSLYDSCWRYLPGWMDDLKSANVADKPPCCRVLFFSTMCEWTNYSLALSVVLAGRNVDIDFAWSLHPHVIVSSPTIGYMHWRRSAATNQSRWTHPRLRMYNLEAVTPNVITNEMEEISSQQALIDTSYLLKKERVQIDSDELDLATFELRRKQNLDTISRVAALLSKRKYDRVIVPNGISLDFGAVFRYVTRLGLPVSSIEMWDITKTVVVSNAAPVVGINTHDLWSQDAPHILSGNIRIRMQQVINIRQKPSTKALTIKYQNVGVKPPEQIRTQLGLCSDKPIVLLCPNVPFDSIFYVERNKNFATMGEWLIKTVEYLRWRTDCQVIIRSHPAEVHFNTTETTENLVRESFPALPEHITVVPPKARINTYSLMSIANLGLVYASTTGLEMAMRGIPIVCGISNQHYNQKGFTIDPGTPEEYFIWIDRVLRDPKTFRLTTRQIELAWCYADLFFNQWPRPFPWHTTSLGSDLKKWPIGRMLSPEGDEKFGEVFNILSGLSSNKLWL